MRRDAIPNKTGKEGKKGAADSKLPEDGGVPGVWGECRGGGTPKLAVVNTVNFK